jgi:Family of unknown function (DUF6184)
MRTSRVLWAPLLASAVLVACGGARQSWIDPGPVGPRMGVTSAQFEPDSVVVERLAGARCNREQRCNDIGPDSAYATRQVCLQDIRGNISDDLNSFRCMSGVRGERLDGCAAALEREKCGPPFVTLARYGKCRAAATCVREPFAGSSP